MIHVYNDIMELLNTVRASNKTHVHRADKNCNMVFIAYDNGDNDNYESFAISFLDYKESWNKLNQIDPMKASLLKTALSSLEGIKRLCNSLQKKE